jgi:hypothetical protein
MGIRQMEERNSGGGPCAEQRPQELEFLAEEFILGLEETFGIVLACWIGRREGIRIAVN